MQLKETSYFPALTGIRAIAAYMVFVHHFNPFSTSKYSNAFFYSVFMEFHVGVTIFFVLSGFLIGFRYYQENNLNIRKYLVNRIARVYPMYFILTTFTYLLRILGPNNYAKFATQEYVYNITFIRGYLQDMFLTGIPQGWSLTVEETFYLVAPLSFLLIRKFKVNLILIPLLFVTTGFFLVSLSDTLNYMGFMRTTDFMFNYTFFGRCFEFFIGVGLAVFLKESKFEFSKTYITYLSIAVIMLCIYTISVVRGEFDYGIRHPLGKVINSLVLPFFGIMPLFYGLIREKTILSKFLGSKPMVLLGKSSYIFYLIHMGFIMEFLTLYVTDNSLINFILLNVISIILFKILEEPLNNLIRRIGSPKVPKPALQPTI